MVHFKSGAEELAEKGGWKGLLSRLESKGLLSGVVSVNMCVVHLCIDYGLRRNQPRSSQHEATSHFHTNLDLDLDRTERGKLNALFRAMM